MAMPGNVLQDIILGVDDDERPSDALYMCMSVAVMLYSLERDFSERDVRPISGTPRSWQRIDRVMYGVGKILCPIFDPLKHDTLAEYADRMKRVRKTYRGIASDAQMRMEFDERAFYAVERRAFTSLKMAASVDLPAQLAREPLKGASY